MTIEIDGLSLEPLPRISITDPGGMETWRQHWEKGRYSNGEIISGVMRNYQRYVDIEADYQAADTALSADVLAEASARADGDVANANLTATVQARVGYIEGALVKNALFRDDWDGASLPPEWSNWNTGTSTRSAPSGIYGAPVYREAMSGTGEVGINQWVYNLEPGRYMLTAKVDRRAGTYPGSGVLCSVRDSSETLLQTITIAFATDPDVNWDVSTSHDGLTTFSQLVEFTHASTDRVLLYAMTQWNTLGAATTKTLDWYELSLTPVDAAGAVATVMQDAFVDSDGNAIARIRQEVAASGSDPALMTLESSDGTSKYGLVASIIRLFNNVGGTTIEVMRAVGGYVFFSNPISIDRAGFRLTLGPNDDLVLWYGADTVDPPDQTLANSKFALDDSGDVYVGTNQAGDLTGVYPNAPYVFGFGSPIGVGTATPVGGSGSYTYSWYQLEGTAPGLTNATTASPTINQNNGRGLIGLTVTDSVSGTKADTVVKWDNTPP